MLILQVSPRLAKTNMCYFLLLHKETFALRICLFLETREFLGKIYSPSDVFIIRNKA